MSDKTDFTFLISLLRTEKITRVRMTFEGAGDSGSTEDAEFFIGKKEVPDVSCRIAVEAALAKIVDNQACNWWDNDGGEGVITLDTKTETVNILIYEYETVRRIAVSRKKVPWSKA